ncbi:MAG: SpoIID/LytB domain-containing protein [Cyanobacteria bacterium P01_A01_bin.37]
MTVSLFVQPHRISPEQITAEPTEDMISQSVVQQEALHTDGNQWRSLGRLFMGTLSGLWRLIRIPASKPTLLGLSTLTVLLGCIVGTVSEASALELRVAIEEEVQTVQVGASTKSLLRDGNGRVIAEIPAMGSVLVESQVSQLKIHQFQGNQFWLEPTESGYVAIGNKWYRGRTLVVAVGGRLTAVNYVDLEEYLYSVVGGEMPTNWPIEALKAQAVAARTYALYRRQTNGNSVFDVGDTTTWQVYKGLEEEASTTHIAVRETAGQVLTYNGRIIESVFHSSSGGHTENVEHVWSNPRPYLQGVADFDQNAPVFQWNEQFSAAELQERISGVGRIVNITPVAWTPRGRVSSVRVVGDENTRTLTGNELRRSLGLRSTLFSIQPEMGRVASTNNVASFPVAFVINGRGFGHGVGMSQWGAQGMASSGYNYQQILGHYFQNSALAVIQVQ